MIYLLYAFGTFATIVILVVLIAAMRPSDFRITRSQVISASAQELFPYINNLKRFQEWNPYKDKDPRARNTFSGPDEGPGASFRWEGDGNVGAGIMTIISQTPHSQVDIDLEFLKPFPGHNQVTFSLAPNGNGTTVSWSMAGRYALIPKIVGLFLSMDKMIGGDFANGLNRLKSLAEAKRN
jgi:hypothetical protein